MSVQIEPLASLAAHPLCFRENGSLAFDNKKTTEGEEKYNFLQAMLYSTAAT